VVDILARHGARDILSIDDIRTKTRWIFAERHGEEVLQVVRRIDQADKARKKAKMDAKKAATAARKEAERQQKEKVRQEKEMARLKMPEDFATTWVSDSQFGPLDSINVSTGAGWLFIKAFHPSDWCLIKFSCMFRFLV